MNGMLALAMGYLGMLVGLGVWTWTVMARSHALEARLAAAEAALALSTGDVDLVAEGER